MLQSTLIFMNQYLQEALKSQDMHNTIEESSCELEETLSLCDLPLYSDQSADWDQEFSLASNSISSSCQEDYFEFFSHKLNAAVPPPENIIFCGKLIPFKQPPTTTCDQEIKIPKRKRSRYVQLFRWKQVPKRQEVSKKIYNTNKLVGKGRGKMSVFTASSSGKGKWYLLMFGFSRFSPVVELRDIKSRQRSLRRQCSSPSPPPLGSPNHDGKVINNDRGWGLWWGLIRALSCGRN